MLEFRDAIQMRSEHAADRAGICRAISVSTDMAEDWANIQTRAAANAMQHFALLRISQQSAATVVDQHHVEFLGPVRLARLPRTANQRAISRNSLPGAGSGQHRPQHGQIFEAWNDFLNPRNYNVNARHAGAEASVAFIGGDGDDAGGGDQKVRAGDAHLGGEKGLAQYARGYAHQIGGIV